ncbi:MAG: tetratricopeptide repeat protein [Candidatus Omnitrophota bacterium]|nr:tetratricopeptide repeat protein [Candidatus Omnitrophota bacterium]
MNRTFVTQLIHGGVAFLLIPGAVACASSLLRKEAAAYQDQGNAAQQQGDVGGALSFYQKAVALDPSSPALHNDIGRILQRQERWREAEQTFQRALAIDPNSVQTHVNLARLYEQMGDEEQAASHWLKANQLESPQDSWEAKTQERLSSAPREHRHVVEEELRAHEEPLQEPSSISRVTEPSAQPAPSSSSERRAVIEEELRAHTESLDEFRAVTEQHRNWP